MSYDNISLLLGLKLSSNAKSDLECRIIYLILWHITGKNLLSYEGYTTPQNSLCCVDEDFFLLGANKDYEADLASTMKIYSTQVDHRCKDTLIFTFVIKI